MPIACRTGSPTNDADGWNRIMGVGWCQVLRSVGLNSEATVVEVGPGFSDKIAHALAALEFCGQLVLVDPTPSARRWARQRYQHLLPGAKILIDPFCLATARPKTRKVDALVSNHVLDDMVFRLAVPPDVSGALFAGMRPGLPCAPEFVQAWQRVQAKPATLEALVQIAGDEFAGYVERIAPRVVIVNEYLSGTHDRFGLTSVHELGLQVLDRLENRLKAIHFVRARAAVPSDPMDVSWLIMSGSRGEPAVSGIDHDC
jgi:hypothetical protein